MKARDEGQIRTPSGRKIALKQPKIKTGGASETQLQIAKRLERRVERERRAREQAEALLEAKTGDLYKASRELSLLAADLEKRVATRTKDLTNGYHDIEGLELLSKPFRKSDLAKKLRRLLEQVQ